MGISIGVSSPNSAWAPIFRRPSQAVGNWNQLRGYFASLDQALQFRRKRRPFRISVLTNQIYDATQKHP